MAALNFPDTPVNGEKYLASNGVEYTYDAPNDTWTGATADLGPGGAEPSPSDISAVPPFEGGDGSQEDPFVITPIVVNVPGGSGISPQVITIANQPALSVGTWEVLNEAPSRFAQPPALFAPPCARSMIAKLSRT